LLGYIIRIPPLTCTTHSELSLGGRNKTPSGTISCGVGPDCRYATLMPFSHKMRFRVAGCHRFCRNSAVKRARAGVVLGWVTSWEVLAPKTVRARVAQSGQYRTVMGRVFTNGIRAGPPPDDGGTIPSRGRDALRGVECGDLVFEGQDQLLPN